MRIYALRHTEVEKADGVCHGRAELPLKSSYVDELAQVIAGLKAIPGLAQNTDRVAIFHSPSNRCARLATDIVDRLGLAGSTPDERLLEYDYGAWDGLRWEEIGQDALDSWMENWKQTRAGGGTGESFDEMIERLRSFLAVTRKALPDNALVILVTHAGVIRCLRHLIGNAPPEEIFGDEIGFAEMEVFEVN